MDDHPVSAVRLLAISMWVLVVLLLKAAWICYFFASAHVAHLIGFTACALAAFAAVAHMRCITIHAVRYLLANMDVDRDRGPRGI